MVNEYIKNQRLHDKQQKEQSFTTVPVNCVEEDYLLTDEETDRDQTQSSLSESRTASAQEPGSARSRARGEKASPTVAPSRHTPDKKGTTKSVHFQLGTIAAK